MYNAIFPFFISVHIFTQFNDVSIYSSTDPVLT